MAARERDSLDGLHIALLTASASRLGGGVAAVVQLQAHLIRQAGGRVSVLALEDEHSAEDRANYGDTPVETVSVTGPRFFGYAPGLRALLARTDPDILHLHGIWMYPSRAAERWARRTGKPYLITPHGMLDPWITARGRWKKALARTGYERASWQRADSLHALTRDEAADIRREAGDRPILTIPNAGPPALPASAIAARGQTVVYLGRIHPKKNLAALVDAWGLAERPAEAELLIAGWGDPADVAVFEAHLEKAPGSARFLGPVHGEAKQHLLQQARFVILPSHSEGLPMTILEAWAAGLPTIMTSACHLPEGFAAGAALECGTDPESIAMALGRALALGEPACSEMSEAALTLARGPFSAEQVTRQWVTAYRGLMEDKAS